MLLAVAALAMLYVVNPTEAGWLPPCPTWYVLHLYCPGCGTARGLHRLAHGDLLGAARMNVLLLPGLALIAAIAFGETRSLLRGTPKPAWVYSPALGRTLVVVVILYCVLRNIPNAPFLWLAPH
jgi:hypothetical protein